MDNNISFSKIAATPTLNSWSQAYNAGKLFAVLSLERTRDLPSEIESLNMLGKDLLERLEQEFFAIEDKNLESIKKAVSTVFENPAENITISFAAGALVDNILYLFGFGNARVFIKRGGALGLALDSVNTTANQITSSSGFLKESDLIVLTTNAFSEVITNDDLDSNLNDIEPSEITEALAPKIHKAENGKISAIVIKYKGPQADPSVTQDGFDETLRGEEIIDEGEQINTQQASKAEKSISPFYKYFSLLKSKFKSASWLSNLKIQPTKKVFLVTAAAIVTILIFSVFFAIRAQNNAKVQALFDSVYPQAQKKYDEGQGLLDVSKIYARESFLSAQKILNDNKDKFPAKSKESIQVQDLLKKVDDGLTQASPIDKSGLDRSTLSIAVANGSGKEGVAARGANILKGFGYNVASTGNADNFNYEGVTIKVKKESNNFLDLLKQDLSKDYTITKTSSDLDSSSTADALVIIGK